MTRTDSAEPPSLASCRTQRVAVADADLVAAVRTGDDLAFTRLYERYQRRITAYVYGMVSDHGRAEDIVQDVFMSALRRMRETEREIVVKPWLHEIAKNACIDQFRRSRRTQEVSLLADEDLSAADAGRLVSTSATPDAAVDQKLAMDDLRGAFRGLSDTHHQILVMRELEGLSYREIGERLDMRRPSVESTLFRARRRLAQEYAALISGERCLHVQAVIAGIAAASPGAREQRRVAAHLSHCQPCRRAAHAAGVDVGLHRRKTARAKIAALLPWPAFLRGRVDRGEDFGAVASTHAPAITQWSSQAAAIDPGLVNVVKAGAVAATLALVGIGSAAGPQGPAQQQSGRPGPAARVERPGPAEQQSGRPGPAARVERRAAVRAAPAPPAGLARGSAGPGTASPPPTTRGQGSPGGAGTSVTGSTPAGAPVSRVSAPPSVGGTVPGASERPGLPSTLVPPSTFVPPSTVVLPVGLPGVAAPEPAGGAERLPVPVAVGPAPASVGAPVIAGAAAGLEPDVAAAAPVTGVPSAVTVPTVLPSTSGVRATVTSTASSVGRTLGQP